MRTSSSFGGSGPYVERPTKTATAKTKRGTQGYTSCFKATWMYSTLPISTSFTQQRMEVKTLRFSMGDIIHNISRVDQAVCWPDFTAPYSTKPSAELSSCFRLTLSCCSTASTIDEVQRYARYAIKLVIYTLVHVMLSYLLCLDMALYREQNSSGKNRFLGFLGFLLLHTLSF